MLNKVLAIVGFAATATCVYGQSAPVGYPAEDYISELWQQPNITDFGVYSGYLNIPHTKKQLHYVAAISQDKADTDPVIIWFNGGPGCSSMIGYALEHGPFVFEDGNVNLTENQYSWNKNASVIYLDSPAGTGYSLCSDKSECNFDDQNSADDNLEAVKILLRDKFTALKSNPLWIAGEAYAGIYVPQLMLRLDQWINESKKTTPEAWVPNLKGFLVGNGFTNYKYDGKPAFVTMAYYHGLIDNDLYEFLTGSCNLTYTQVLGFSNLTKECQDGMDTLAKYTQYANMFDVFGKCYKSQEGPQTHSKMSLYESNNKQEEDGVKHLSSNAAIPCLWSQPMVDYFNNETVKEQFKIPSEYSKEPWIACQLPGIHPISYTLNETGSAWIYNELRGKGYKMLKYSGDADGIVPTIGTQQWIDEMKWPVTEEWRPYFVKVSESTKKVGGYVEVRDDFTLATVHGAGHMAPKFKRKQTYHAVFNFINGIPL